MNRFFQFISLTVMICVAGNACCQNITKAEYFIDHDPGAGNGTALAVPAPGNPITLTSFVATSGLRQGHHNLFIRTKNATKHWSFFNSRPFYIEVDIIAAEYFFDNDPGVGRATSIPVTNQTNMTEITSSINVGSLPEGDHTVTVRTKDRLGAWSHNEPLAFTIETPLPLSLSAFEVETTGTHKVTVTWTTASEVNNDFFTLERSSSATEFSEIARVAGAGISVTARRYSRVDDHPGVGWNYYRLKQTDFDGRFTYSNVKAAQISFDEVPRIYPIPSSSEWFIDLSKLPIDNTYEISVDDVIGRRKYEHTHVGGEMLRFISKEFAAGSYIVTIRSQRRIVLKEKVVLY